MAMAGRALVTGADGFVGGYLCPYLAEHGWEVVPAVMDVGDAPDDAICADIRDASQVRELLANAGPVTHVFHLAAVSFAPEAGGDPLSAFEVNLNGTIHLTQAIVEFAPQARFLFISSGAVYGLPQFLPVTEDHPLTPGDPYGISKAAADHFCGYLYDTRQLNVIRLRPFNHSGPGQSDQFVLSSFARQIAAIEAGDQEPVVRVGNIHTARDFTHVRDVVRAYELAAREADSGGVYNICSGRAWTIKDALDQLIARSRADVRVETDETRVRAADVLEVVGSHAKFSSRTGWTPAIPFDQMLNDLLRYWRRRYEAEG